MTNIIYRLKIWFSLNDLLVLSGVFILFLLSFILFYLQVSTPFAGDLDSHLKFALELMKGQRTIPHPGFHYSILFLSKETGLTLEVTASLLLAAAISTSYFIVYFILKHRLGARYPVYFLVSVSLILAVASAIYAPFFNKNIYLGQGTPNIWHNPTWIMMQPFALLCFFLTERYLQLSHWDNWMIGMASAALVISAFFKPSFALVFIPALALYSLLVPAFKRFLNLNMVGIVMIVMPTLILMGFQYQIKYSPDKIQATSVIFAPFEVWGAKTPSIAFSTLLTLAFPLATVFLKPKSLIEQQGYLLAWLLVLVAFLQRLLLAESGGFKPHGNWAWGYFIAIKVIFIYSLLTLMNNDKPKEYRYFSIGLIPWAILVLHGISGIIYLYRLFSVKSFY